MEFIEAKKFREEAEKSIKFFPDELVAMLSKENKEIYDKCMNTEYSKKDMFFKQDFEKMYPVLDEMRNHLNQPVNIAHQDKIMNMYVKGVINQIMMERNKIVSSGHYDEEIKKQLENLTTCINDLASYEGKSTYIGGFQVDIISEEGVYDHTGKLTSVIDYSKKIKEMQEMLKNDNQRYPIYVEYLNQRKQKARDQYNELKTKYEQRSKIGKFIARFTGKEEKLKQELENAKRNSDYIFREEAALQNDDVVSLDKNGQFMSRLGSVSSNDNKIINHQGKSVYVENGAVVTPAEYEKRLELLEENNWRER